MCRRNRSRKYLRSGLSGVAREAAGANHEAPGGHQEANKEQIGETSVVEAFHDTSFSRRLNTAKQLRFQHYQRSDKLPLFRSKRMSHYFAKVGGVGTGAFGVSAEPDPAAAAEPPAPPVFRPRPLLGGPLPPPLGP